MISADYGRFLLCRVECLCGIIMPKHFMHSKSVTTLTDSLATPRSTVQRNRYVSHGSISQSVWPCNVPMLCTCNVVTYKVIFVLEVTCNFCFADITG